MKFQFTESPNFNLLFEFEKSKPKKIPVDTLARVKISPTVIQKIAIPEKTSDSWHTGDSYAVQKMLMFVDHTKFK